MKYYLLRTASDPQIKGIKNGLDQVALDEKNPVTAKLQDFFSGINYWERNKYVPDFEVKNCTASLVKNANLTDFLDFRPGLFTCPFMISERLADLLSRFNIQKYYTFPVTIYSKGKEVTNKYYLFCCPLLGFDVVNFPESIFYIPKGIFERNYVMFRNEEEYRRNKDLKQVERFVLNSRFDSSLDLFMGRIGEMYISEALKDAIQILGLTGVNIFDDKEPEIIIETS